MKGLFLRIGIDTGSGSNALSPIFDDETFEYIPWGPECKKTYEDRTYGDTEIKNHYGKSLGCMVYSDFLPKALKCKKNKNTGKRRKVTTINARIHFDPEFDTYTYGDPTSVKRSALLKLDKNDYIFFYAGLKPYNSKKYKRGNYLTGYFKIKEIVDFSKLNDNEVKKAKKIFSNNAHMKRTSPNLNKLVIIKGHSKYSKLLIKPILISQTKGSHQYFKLEYSKLLLKKLNEKDPITCHYAIPHWITEKGTLKLLPNFDS